MITHITVRGRTPADRKDRDLDLFPSHESEDEREWIGLSIRQPEQAESFATVRVLRGDLLRALEALWEGRTIEFNAGSGKTEMAVAAFAAVERIEWLIDQVKARRLSYGKAAELAGLPKARFVQMMAKRQVSPVDYDEEELAAELRAAADLPGP